MREKVRKIFFEACEAMELIMAFAVMAGIAVAAIALFLELVHYWENSMETGAFLGYIDAVFNVVIGIEFVKMLCKPSSANIIEVLIFLIARHMIIQTTTAGADLLSVISIGILFLFRRFMVETRPDKNHHIPNIFGRFHGENPPEEQDAADGNGKEL